MKKTILITLFALLGMTRAVAQEYEYVPFVREGVKWVYFYNNQDNGFSNPDLSLGKVYLTLELRGDTVIYGKTYKAMHKYFGDAINEENDTIPIYLREEDKVIYGFIPNKTIYPDCPIGIGGSALIYDNMINDEEFILYDFNDPAAYLTEMLGWKYEDDEFYYSITSVDTIMAGDKLVKRFSIGYNDSATSSFSIIEGIGFDSMVSSIPGYTLFPLWKMNAYSAYFALSHVIEDGEIIYKAREYEEPQPNDYEYVPFVREGVKWVYHYINDGGSVYPPDPNLSFGTVYLTLEMKGDTIINGKTYKAMHKYYGDNINEGNDTIAVYLREQDKVVYGIVPDGKVYSDCFLGYGSDEDFYLNIWGGNEFVLYDFNNPRQYYENIFNIEPDEYNDICYLYSDTIRVGEKPAIRSIFDFFNQDVCFIEGIGYDGFRSGFPLAYMYFEKMSDPPFHLSYVMEGSDTIYVSINERVQGHLYDYLSLSREGVQWVNERVTVQNGDTTNYYYKYEFKSRFGWYDSCYYYTGETLNGDDITIAAMNDIGGYARFVRNDALDKVVEQGREMLDFTQSYSGGYYLYLFRPDDFDMSTATGYYIACQKEPFLTKDIFVKTDPVIIDGHSCSRYVYLGEDEQPLAYVVEGIGFDSYDMGDLLTPFTRKPDPNADYQEWCGLSHVVKNGEIIYKGMRYREGAADGIDEVVADKTRRPLDPNYYNLMGQPVGKEIPTSPGIYIHHGNKIIIR